MRGVRAARGGGEGEEDGGLLVGAGGGVFFDSGEDGGGFAVGGGDGVVEGLEAPGQGVDADWVRFSPCQCGPRSPVVARPGGKAEKTG